VQLLFEDMFWPWFYGTALSVHTVRLRGEDPSDVQLSVMENPGGLFDRQADDVRIPASILFCEAWLWSPTRCLAGLASEFMFGLGTLAAKDVCVLSSCRW